MTPEEAGKAALCELKKTCARAGTFCKELLESIIRDNENTEYGTKCNFKDIHSVDEFRKTVPFSTYSDYDEYIKRMVKGEKKLMTVYPIIHYATTSGSVGVPKKIPVSNKTIQLYAKYTSNAATALIAEYVQKKEGRQLKNGKRILTAVVSQGTVADGTSTGAISGKMYWAVRDLMKRVVASPEEVLYSSEKMDFKYLKAFYGLKEPNVTVLAAPFSTAAYDLLSYIENNWQTLCDDIEKGAINKDVEISISLREKFNSELRPDPERATELRKIFGEGFDKPFVRRVWPNLEYINAIGAGGFVSYTKMLRRYTGDLPMVFGNYAASEAMMAVVTEVESMEYTLIPEGGFYEFIPVDSDYEDEKQVMEHTLLLNELEVGKDYEIVITNLSGLYRYRIGDVITVVGYEGESPKVCFHYRKNQMISLAGEKTNEDCIRYVAEKISEKIGKDVLDYSIYADRSTKPGRYHLLMEAKGHVPQNQLPSCRDVAEDAMSYANPSYGNKIKEKILSPMLFDFVLPETYMLYREVMLKKGVSENQLKPVRVIDNPFKEKFFFGLLDRE
ncbi:GH3 auxin-responsive promoter family protein [Fibrobacter sp.]|uniref:GH3 auxin-responsive promoter family protein n=1 Tax=Fibrobacter sp. TaxID=35828 RepID=UPI00388EF6CB